MNKKYIAILLVVLVAAAEATSVSKQPWPTAIAGPDVVNDAELQEYVIEDIHAAAGAVEPFVWDGLGVSADVNDYVDDTISMLVPYIQSHGLDPMPLPDVVEGFSVKLLLITYSAWLKITDGVMTGLARVERSGDQKVNYFAKMLRVQVNLQFRDARFDYRYLVKVMKIGPTGGIAATLSRFRVVADVLIDFNNDEVHLQRFSLTDIGRLRVRFTGNILTDWLVNPVLNVFLRIFDNIIIKVVEVNIYEAVQDGIGVLNSNMHEVIHYIESYNLGRTQIN